MPRSRRRNRRDSSVVRTEPDNRRATGRDDEDEFEAEAKESTVLESRWIRRASIARSQGAKAGNSSGTAQESFPFMNLPVEIRNMIYRYLLISKASGPIALGHDCAFARGGIEIAILLASHQVHEEAIKILYNENKCLAVYGMWDSGVSFRTDDPKTESITSRTLRSGRAVDMVRHRGLIYPKSFFRLRNVEFQINIFSRKNMCDHLTILWAKRLYAKLDNLASIIFDLADTIEYDDFAAPTRRLNWAILVRCPGNMPLHILERMLEAVQDEWLELVVVAGMMRVVLEGEFPQGWESLFGRLLEWEGLNIDGVKEPAVAVPFLHPSNVFQDLMDTDLFWDNFDEDYFW